MLVVRCKVSLDEKIMAMWLKCGTSNSNIRDSSLSVLKFES